eukprot:TRINITY_DN2542_c2_g2_i1.p1 TRINITY_DN2542_c2_g2~~TRINITY_DN2542_c2_g2_i1.p1  ORF type:complete len:269 (+),score=69.06 TRINITY_DN2542_c2_g2_i1:1076-1882(+)
MGHPVYINSGKYHRNMLLFNLCMVFDENKNTKKYEPLLIKMASYLETLEMENQFLSLPHLKSSLLPPLLERLFLQLNLSDSSVFSIDEGNRIYLKMYGKKEGVKKIRDEDVPIPVVDLKGEDWSTVDLTLNKIIPHIDGSTEILSISRLSNVSLSLVKKAIQHLLYYNFIIVVDLFEYENNRYATTEKIHDLFQNKKLQNQCLIILSNSVSGTEVTFDKIFPLYCKINPSLTVKQFSEEHNLNTLLDPRKFISFGVSNGILRKIFVPF